ncbi:hypothetical protein [Actinomadura napierensis]
MKAKSFWKLIGKGGNDALAGRGFGRGLAESGGNARNALEMTGQRIPFKQAYDWEAPAVAGEIKVAVGFAQAAEDSSRIPSREEINQKVNLQPPDVQQ